MRLPFDHPASKIASTFAAASALWLAPSSDTRAQIISCSGTTSPATLDLGAVIPWSTAAVSTTGSITVNCANTGPFPTNVAICLSVGTGSAGTGVSTRQITTSGTATPVGMGIHITSAGSLFGSWYYGQTAISAGTQPIRANSRTEGPGKASFGPIPITVTLDVPQATTTLPSARYHSSYLGTNTAIAFATSDGTPNCASTQPGSGMTFGFVVQASVPGKCEFSGAIGDLNFGSVTGIHNPSVASNTGIALRCTQTTPYRVSVTPSNQDANGKGQMSRSPADAGGNDTVPYALFQDAGASARPWGNQTGNYLSATGTGAIQTHTVYGRVPANLNVTPGNYRDSVVVTVTY